MTNAITHIDALEILDSRGVPTLQVELGLDSGARVTASVPSGASTGVFEAHELRDRDPLRYGGRGVFKAAANVRDVIGPALFGRDVCEQEALDRQMIELDGTDNKSRLGANAILGVSMAVARAAAVAKRLPLYVHLADGAPATLLPCPMMNVINGGLHAKNELEFQEFMLVPHGAPTFGEALRWGAETFVALRNILLQRGLSTGIGDEGGFAPDLRTNEQACELIVEAITAAGFDPGRQISIALDPAASTFANAGVYHLPSSPTPQMTSEQLGALYADWIRRFSIVSIEDGFDEGDWGAFASFTKSVGDQIQIVGDDLFVTDPAFIRQGIEAKAANAALIKLNQIGTVSEAIAAIAECRRAGWAYVISHRSGETDDTFIADFAVAMGGGQIKSGSLCRGERIAKYNRLLVIERDLGQAAEFAKPFAARRPTSRNP